MAEVLGSFAETTIATQPTLVNGDLSTAAVCFVVLPGNPSIKELYTPFGALLTAKFGCPVLIPTLHDQTSSTLTLERAVSLKQAFFEELHRQHPRLKVIVLAHSIGNYIGLHALQHVADVEFVRAYFGIFPTLRFLRDGIAWHWRLLCSAFWVIVAVSFLVDLLACLPAWLVAFFLVHLFDVPSAQVPAVQTGLSGALLGQMLMLTRDEADRIGELTPEFVRFLTAFAPRMDMLYGTHDRYADGRHAEHLRATVPGARVTVLDLPHAFVLGAAEAVFAALEPRLARAVVLCEREE